ncbi:MAG: hypothetical protein H7257_03445 [Taibaiella sp.]|nr:hypothetical protein [Taibaiella sp.]
MKQIISFMALAMLFFSCVAHSKTPAGCQQKIIARKVVTDYGTRVGNISIIVQDKAGRIWVGSTLQGLYLYDDKGITNFTAKDGLGSDYITSVMEARDGVIWVGTEAGISRYNGKSFTPVSIPASDERDFLPAFRNDIGQYPRSRWAGSLVQDRAGNIWFKTTGFGIYCIDGKSGVVRQTGMKNFMKREASMPDTKRDDLGISAIVEDRKGNLWFTTGSCGTKNATYRLAAARVSHPCVMNTCRHHVSNPIDAAAHNREIESGLTKIETREGRHSIAFTSFLEDKAGNIWLGTWDSGAYRYNGQQLTHFLGKEGFDHNLVGTIFEDKSGSIWFGTGTLNSNNYEGNGAFRYDGKTLTHFTSKDGLCNKGKFHANTISCITQDSDGKIWFGSDGDGACYYDGRSFTSFGAKEGLSCDRVYCVLSGNTVGGSNVWFGAEEMGLYRYNGKGFTSFTRKVQAP